jgi:hypothetical protein
MANYAIYSGGTIMNVIVADSQEVAEQVTGMFALETDGVPWIGWTLVDDKWVAPSSPEPNTE